MHIAMLTCGNTKEDNMNNTRKIKGYETQCNKLKTDADLLKVEIATKQREYSRKLMDIDAINEKIRSIKNNKDIVVSEHAILRYLERVDALDIEKIKTLILSEEVMGLVEELGGNGSYPADGFKVVMKDNVVTTIIT